MNTKKLKYKAKISQLIREKQQLAALLKAAEATKTASQKLYFKWVPKGRFDQTLICYDLATETSSRVPVSKDINLKERMCIQVGQSILAYHSLK